MQPQVFSAVIGSGDHELIRIFKTLSPYTNLTRFNNITHKLLNQDHRKQSENFILYDNILPEIQTPLELHIDRGECPHRMVCSHLTPKGESLPRHNGGPEMERYSR